MGRRRSQAQTILLAPIWSHRHGRAQVIFELACFPLEMGGGPGDLEQAIQKTRCFSAWLSDTCPFKGCKTSQGLESPTRPLRTINYTTRTVKNNTGVWCLEVLEVGMPLAKQGGLPVKTASWGLARMCAPQRVQEGAGPPPNPATPEDTRRPRSLDFLAL